MTNLKAYKCWVSRECWCLLTFAESYSKAKLYANHYVLSGWGAYVYTDWLAKRAKPWDGIAEGKSEPFIIDFNHDIPKGYPPFYNETEGDEFENYI